MRIKKNAQMTIWEVFSEHTLSQELRAISELLDRHPRISEWVLKDLLPSGVNPTGREGYSADSITRAAILKQIRGLTYDDLAFAIDDSASTKAFTRISGKAPSKSMLQSCISSIKPETWEKINREILRSAANQGLETGRMTRTDSTVMESNIHKPSDSSLLYDCVRAATNLLIKSPGEWAFQNHTRGAKKHARMIQYSRKGKKQKQAYRKLLRLGKNVFGYLATAIAGEEDLSPWAEKAKELLSLIGSVINQTEKRVFMDEKVPPQDKVVSIFEPHTDIIKKGNRETQFGHKLNLTTGRTGLVIDMVVEKGNPADSITAVRMVKRQEEIYGRPPRQTCFDGCYGSKDNLLEIKNLGVKDVAFHKKRNLKVEDMVRSQGVYKKLLKFRAGVEGDISVLKRGYGWKRCNWNGFEGFKAYAWLSVLSYNLVTLTRLQ